MDPAIKVLESNLGIEISSPDLFLTALTHRSYLNEDPKWPYGQNERLEYLGDAVLELAVSRTLFDKFGDAPEGRLTLLRAALVNYQSMARVADEAGIGDLIKMSRGESRDTGRAREVILANASEALIGAIYLDKGFAAAASFVDKFVMRLLPEILKNGNYKDPKSELQEVVQEKLKVTPTYRVLAESGPAHDRRFTVGVYFGEDLQAEGDGKSKQEAETEAARNALNKAKQ